MVQMIFYFSKMLKIFEKIKILDNKITYCTYIKFFILKLWCREMCVTVGIRLVLLCRKMDPGAVKWAGKLWARTLELWGNGWRDIG